MITRSLALCLLALPPGTEALSLEQGAVRADVATRGFNLNPLGFALDAYYPCLLGPRGVLVPVVESWQGGADLNGDGDTQDVVVHYHDLASGITTNLGVATGDWGIAFVSPLVAIGPRFLIPVSERSQGWTDLNGDGDAGADADRVLHVFDPATGVLQNLGVESNYVVVDKRWANVCAFSVSEGQQGHSDLNGDGDSVDQVVFTYDSQRREIHNTGLPFIGTITVDGGRVMVPRSESADGGTDFNGDGDAADEVAHLYDVRTRTAVNLGYPMYFRLHLGQDALLRARFAAFGTTELDHGGTDLNGDGDLDDEVMVVHDVLTGVTTCSGMAYTFAGGRPHVDRGFLHLAVEEAQQGGTDLNGDGDADDVLSFRYDLRTHTPVLLGPGGGGFPAQGGPFVVHTIEESHYGGADMNQDGDSIDSIFVFADLLRGVQVSTGLAGYWSTMNGSHAFVFANETYQGNRDLNGDGDTTDESVLFLVDLRRRTLTNTGHSFGTWFPDAYLGHTTGGDLLGMCLSEEDDQQDYDGDGSIGGHVLCVRDLVTGQETNLGVQVSGGGVQVKGDHVLFRAREQDLGDLNGDGDTGDTVPMVVTRTK